MEKSITLDGKEVVLKVNASCQRRYKMQFRREFIKDIYKLKKLDKLVDADGNVTNEDALIAEIDFELFGDLLWLFAKTADKTIPAPLEWEEQFDNLPIQEILPVVMELLTVMLDSVKKN